MGNTEALELGRIRVDIPVPYTAIKELHITDHANEYGTMHLCLILPGAEENIAGRMEGQPVTVLTPQKEVVFAGLCTGVGLVRGNEYVEMCLEARSHAYVTDRVPRSRTFQSQGKTLAGVAGIVLEGYAVSLELERDIPIGQMLSQQEETDWQFLRRIANQFGMLIYTDVKSAGIRLHIGTVPFSSRSLTLEDEYSAKDISMYWDVKQNTREDASAYEFLQRGGTLEDLTVGSGCLVEGKDVPQIVTGSEITSWRGLLRNEILLSYVDGAVPVPREVFHGSHRGTGTVSDAPAVPFTSVLTGEVSQVCGTDIEVDFGRGQEDTRWIPYTNLLGNDVYAMPDEKDKVFCYYDNGGEVVALGSKVEDTSSPDYGRPYEKSLTANNRMIRFREEGIDLTGSRSEYDGGEGRQVKITFSDTEGIDIAAEGDISITAAGDITLQARELPGEGEDPTAWFDCSFEANMEEFTARHEAGAELYLAHNGKVSDPTMLAYLLEMRRMIGESTEKGIARALMSAIRFITENPAFNVQEGQEEPPALVFDSVEDKRISMVALGELQVTVGGSGIRLIGNHVYISTAYFEQLGLQTRGGYPEVSESPRSGMDVFLDFVNVAIDIAVMCNVALYPLKLITVGIYFFRGDYASAALSLIPFCKIGSLFEKAPKVVKMLCYVKAGVDIANANVSTSNAISRLGELYSRQGLSMFGDLEAWEGILAVTQGAVDVCQSAKYMNELEGGGNSRRPPEGDETRGSGSGDTGEPKPVAGRPDGSDTKPANNQYGLDPVNVVTGSQKITQTEFVIRDIPGDFLVQRHYESIYKNSGSMLGERWFLNVGSYLSVQGDSAVIILPDRHLERFARQEDGSWRNRRGGDGSVTLTEKNRKYLLYQQDTRKSYWYDPAGKLTAMEDRNGNTIHLKYMGEVLVEMDFPCGQALTFQYERGKLESITDAIGRTVQYAYEGELLTQVTYPNGGTISYQYTGEGFLTGITDQNGNLYVQNEYARDGRVTRQFLNRDTEHVILYDDHNRTNTFLNMCNGGRVEYHYNTDRLIMKTVYSDGSTEEIRYDDRQNKVWEKDRRGNELSRVYDPGSRLLEETLPNGLYTRYGYNDEGLPAHVWDNAGRQQWYQYDRNGNLTEIRQEIMTGVVRRVQFTYDSLGRVKEILDANGNRTAYTYEGALGLPSTVTTPEGHMSRYTYDRAGRCMEATDEGGTTGYAYNHMDRVTMVTNPLGETTRYYYDGLCNLSKVVRPNQAGRGGSGAGTEYAYDALDGITMTVDPLGNVHATPRDGEGNILKEIHPNAYDPATGDGEGIAYEYDVFNRRTKIRYPDGGVERIKYDAAGNIVEKISPLQYDEAGDGGNGWNYRYDEMNRLAQVTDPEGNVQKRYLYDLHGNIVKLITAEGYLTGSSDQERAGELYRYNHMGWLTESRKPVKKEGGTVLYRLTQYRYDLAGNMTRELRYLDYQTADSGNGAIHAISYEYDRDNRLTRVSDSTGAVLEYGYDGAGRRTRERRKLNDTTDQVLSYVHDGAGRVTEVRQSADEEGCGRKASLTRYEYDANGNITRIRLPYGAEVRREYDAADRLVSETHLEKKTGIHNTTRFRYDRAGNLTEVLDNRGNSVRMEYSLLDQETRRTGKDGGITRSFHDLDGRLCRVVRPNEYHRLGEKGQGYGYSYDLLGRLARVTRPDGSLQEENRYDRDGLLVQTTDGAGRSIRYVRDLGGRLILVHTDGSAAQRYEYDASGNITGAVDGEGNRTEYILDQWGRTVEVRRADGASEHYGYDHAGNLTSSTDANGNTTRYGYNCAGLVERVTDPLGGEESYRYDTGGRLAQVTDRNGTVTSYSYNLYGNLTARTARDPAHPGRGLSETYGYTPEGLLRSAVSGGMSYRYEHDAEGRLVGKSASGRTLLSLAYDLDGNLTRQEDVTGKVTEYTYNALDQLERVTDNGTMVAEYAYYPDGARKSLANGSLYTEYSYDGDRNLAGLKTVLGTEVLADNRYRYDRNGNRTEKQQAGGTTRYTYDSLNRLAKVEYPSHTEELYYDRAGNRSCRVANGVEELYRYDPRNRLTEYTRGGMRTKYEYDNAGNLLADDRARYTYDAFNRTERVETFDSHVQVNRYDPEGLRHELEEDGKLVRYIFRGDEVVAEETEGNIIRLVRGTELLASDAEHARTYYHYASDELGSVTHVVTGQERDSADGAEVPEGSVLNRYRYDAWGNLALCEETVLNRFLYTGQQYDPVTRQYYLRARYYNPVIARFTQEDTYRGDGLNLYTYCRNNPVCHVDPSGHCGKDPNGDFMPPAVVPEGKQLPAVYVPQQEALRRWCANFQDDAGAAGRAGTGGNGDFMPPAVIPKQPLPSLDPKRPSLVPEPPRQLPAVIYPQPQDLLGGNPQNRVSGPAADVPNSGNRVSGSVPKPDFIVTPNGTVMDTGKNYNLIGSGMQGDWFQIHNIGKPEDVGFPHTHSPQLNTDGQHTSYNRVVTSTVADDIDLADHLLRTGKMTFRKKGRR